MKFLTKAKSKNSLSTWILYLNPAEQNSKGINLCPFASKGCLVSCIHTAGSGGLDIVKEARARRTELLVKNRRQFYMQLAKEILSKVAYYQRKNQMIAFRLNGTSDIDHAKALKVYAGLEIEDLHGKAVFFDFTKSIHMAVKYKDSPNYILTFSRAEDNQEHVLTAMEYNINVSVVFSNKPPKEFLGKSVIDGGQNGIMMIYNRNVIIGILAKGAARKDTTGFTIQN